jgi:cell division protein FtsN
MGGAIEELNKIVESLVVTNAEEEKKAVEILGKIKQYQKRSEDNRTTLVKPLNDHVKMINARFKETSAPLVAMERKAKSVILKFKQAEQKRLDEERKKQEEEDRKAFEAERKKKLEEANNRKEKKEIKQEEFTPTEKPVEKKTPVRTESGTASTKKVWNFEVIDPTTVPDDYKVIDEKLIRVAVRNGVREIKGVRIFEEDQLNMRAK